MAAAKRNSEQNGFRHVQDAGDIREYQLLGNGLRVLVKEDRTLPVAGFMVVYHVGSRNEASGHTGATHLLEHLLFKGSKKFPGKEGGGENFADRVANMGGIINATTWLDRTNYYAVLPSERIEFVVEAEADRMRNAFITKEDLESEMPVVRNEFEISENDPYQILSRNVEATAFQAHPYHHPTIGWLSDIENVSIDRLKAFYDTYYWPNNATVVAAGDFDTGKMLALIKKHFGKIKRSPHPIPDMYTREPEQEGPRSVVVERPISTNIVAVAHKIPPTIHPDTPALHVLVMALASGKNSRLYRALVDTGIATSIDYGSVLFKDAPLLTVFATLTHGTKHATAERKLLGEYRKVAEKGITGKELNAAKSIVRSLQTFGSDGIYPFLSSITSFIAVGDWTLQEKYEERIAAVTAEEVRACAERYLIDRIKTTGTFIGTKQDD